MTDQKNSNTQHLFFDRLLNDLPTSENHDIWQRTARDLANELHTATLSGYLSKKSEPKYAIKEQKRLINIRDFLRGAGEITTTLNQLINLRPSIYDKICAPLGVAASKYYQDASLSSPDFQGAIPKRS